MAEAVSYTQGQASLGTDNLNTRSEINPRRRKVALDQGDLGLL